jgi:hypothetical protein
MVGPLFLICLRPEPGVDATKALRGTLKTLLRTYGLRCTAVSVQRRMLSLTDDQLRTIELAARDIDHEKRDLFIKRVAALMRFRSRHDDLRDVVELARVGLVQTDGFVGS